MTTRWLLALATVAVACTPTGSSEAERAAACTPAAVVEEALAAFARRVHEVKIVPMACEASWRGWAWAHPPTRPDAAEGELSDRIERAGEIHTTVVGDAAVVEGEFEEVLTNGSGPDGRAELPIRARLRSRTGRWTLETVEAQYFGDAWAPFPP